MVLLSTGTAAVRAVALARGVGRLSFSSSACISKLPLTARLGALLPGGTWLYQQRLDVA